jgi:hypothetical protein
MKVKKTVIYKGVAMQINARHYSALGWVSRVTLSNAYKYIRFQGISINQVINEMIHYLDTGKMNLDTEIIRTNDDIKSGIEKSCTIYE